ncbi:MAG: hypothetical protein OEV06_10270 [Anaerolineae bacterium]|nr:hypothetical protein [Anaerolineae bacterium]
MKANNHIGTLREKSLHASLKDWYKQSGDLLETEVDGYMVDILRGETLIEFQTKNFSSIKPKLEALTQSHPVYLVHPIAKTKWIVRVDTAGKELSRRRSPKRGKLVDIFSELVYIPKVCREKNFTFEAVLIEAEEIWQDDGKGSWRRKGWSIADRHLVRVISRQRFRSPSDYANLFPDALPDEFSNVDVANLLKIRPRLAQKMTYTLRAMGTIEFLRKNGRANLYARAT